LNEQQHVIDLTVEYLAKTLPKLPNRYATRTTVRYDNGRSMKRARAKSQDDSSSCDHSLWRIVGSSKVVVAYRNGKEVVDLREWGKHPSHPEDEGLITRGTFGPILSTVIADAARGEMPGTVGSAEVLAHWRCFAIAYRKINRIIPQRFTVSPVPREVRTRARDITAKWRSTRLLARFCV
jgi:hypothetical protein